MWICFPSIVPKQLGKFHVDWNVSDIFNQSSEVDGTKDVQDKKDWHLYLSLCYMLAVIATLLPWSN